MGQALRRGQELVHERVWKAALAGDGVEPFLQVWNTAALHEVARAQLIAYDDGWDQR